ncbi:MAG: hypothetical protein LLG24_07465 [Actinomycetia bacterium]|nr:hypothetical protein [Actinomycetes bacterium]
MTADETVLSAQGEVVPDAPPSVAYLWFCAYERKHGPSRDILGPYWDSFLRFTEASWDDLSEEKRLELARDQVEELVAEAEATRDWRGEVHAFYLQQRLKHMTHQREGESD